MRYIAGGTIRNACWRIITNDKIWRSNDLVERCQDYDKTEFQKVWQNLKTNKAPDSVAETANAQSVARVLRYGRAIRTERGYVGMAAEDSKPGDCIYILAGGSEPFVLRTSDSVRRAETFNLVGTSYVHGIMDGDALSGTSKKRKMTWRDWRHLSRFGGYVSDRRLPLQNFVDLVLE